MESMPETQEPHPPTVLATTLPFFARAATIVDETWHDLDQMAGVLDRCLDRLGRRERRACFLRADDQRDSGSRTPARADRGGTRRVFAGSVDGGLSAGDGAGQYSVPRRGLMLSGFATCQDCAILRERRRLEGELARLLVELGDLRDQLESSPAPQRAGLESRMAELRARWAELPPERD